MSERPKQAASCKLHGLPRGLCVISLSMQGHCDPCASQTPSAHFLACTIGFVPFTSAMWQHSCVPLHHHDHRVQLLHAQRYLSEAGWHGRVDPVRPNPQREPPVSIGRLFSRHIFQNVSGRYPLTHPTIHEGCGSPRLLRLCTPRPPLCTTATQSRLSTPRFEREAPRVCPPFCKGVSNRLNRGGAPGTQSKRCRTRTPSTTDIRTRGSPWDAWHRNRVVREKKSS